MRESKVPIDMASEQKNLMGVASTRQAIYLAFGGGALYAYLPLVFSFSNQLFGWAIAIGLCIFTALPVIAIVVLFGFIPVSKFNMPRDYYMLIYLQRANNVGLWRKGN